MRLFAMILRRALLALMVPMLVGAGEKKPKPKPPAVEVLEAAAKRTTEGTIELDGRVRNCGEKPIEGLVLLFNMLAPGDEIVTRQRGRVEQDVVEPGEEVEFHWQMREPPRAVRFRVGAADGREMELPVQKSGPYPIE